MGKMKSGEREPMSLDQAIAISLLLIDYEQELCPSKANGWYRQLCEVKTILSELKESNTMSTDMNFFRGSRTKATTPAQPQAPEMPDSVKKQLEQLAAQFNRLKEAIQVIEARLTALEGGQQTEEKKIKANGHNVRSFQADIVSHSKGVRK